MAGNYLDRFIQLVQVLYDQTDSEHMLTRSEIMDRLNRNGTDMNRQTFATYIRKLKESGVDIMEEKSDHFRYGIGFRIFDFAEIKLITDAILSSSAIDEEKSQHLIQKLHRLLSRFQAQELKREQLPQIKKKQVNQYFYQNVDMINTGIINNCKIAFRYFTYRVNEQGNLCKISRKEGKVYKVSPYSFCWHQDNYYVLVSDDHHDSLAAYRIDRMDCVRVLEEPRKSLRDCKLENLEDLSVYLNGLFSMHSGNQGQRMKVELEFNESVLNVVVDKFGEFGIYRKNQDWILAHFDVVISPTFYSWLFQLKDQIRIISPKSAVRGFQDYLQEVLNFYQQE